MNIFASPGDTVRFANPKSAYGEQVEHAAKYLTEGEVYTIARVVVRSTSTRVSFAEVDDKANLGFGSCMFDDVNIDEAAAEARGIKFAKLRRVPFDTNKD